MTKNEALKLALEALEHWDVHGKLHQLTEEAITAIKEALAQPEQQVDWEKLYRLEVKKKEALAAKYERDIKPLTKIVPMAQPEQEQTGIREIRVTETVKQKPVAWMCDPFGDDEYEFSEHQECENCVPCYATPTKREWVGLTDEHIGIILNDPNIAEVHQGAWLVLPYAYAYAIEAKLKEKNT